MEGKNVVIVPKVRTSFIADEDGDSCHEEIMEGSSLILTGKAENCKIRNNPSHCLAVFEENEYYSPSNHIQIDSEVERPHLQNKIKKLINYIVGAIMTLIDWIKR